eukprot:6995656-Pyramimonas_sp.AAC.1
MRVPSDALPAISSCSVHACSVRRLQFFCFSEDGIQRSWTRRFCAACQAATIQLPARGPRLH